MFDKMLFAFTDWYNKYDVEISWFVIGLLTSLILEQLARGNNGWALFNAIVLAVNILTRPKR